MSLLFLPWRPDLWPPGPGASRGRGGGKHRRSMEHEGHKPQRSSVMTAVCHRLFGRPSPWTQHMSKTPVATERSQFLVWSRKNWVHREEICGFVSAVCAHPPQNNRCGWHPARLRHYGVYTHHRSPVAHQEASDTQPPRCCLSAKLRQTPAVILSQSGESDNGENLRRFVLNEVELEIDLLCLYTPRMLCCCVNSSSSVHRRCCCCSHLDIKVGSGSGHVSG